MNFRFDIFLILKKQIGFRFCYQSPILPTKLMKNKLNQERLILVLQLQIVTKNNVIKNK